MFLCSGPERRAGSLCSSVLSSRPLPKENSEYQAFTMQQRNIPFVEMVISVCMCNIQPANQEQCNLIELHDGHRADE